MHLTKLNSQNLTEKFSNFQTVHGLVFQEGHWIWENSGVPFTFGKYRRGENKHCLYIDRYDKEWKVANCNDTMWFKPLCQINA